MRFLDRLERDLVEAIERRDSDGARAPRRRGRRRIPRVNLAAASVLAVLVLGPLAILAFLPEDENKRTTPVQTLPAIDPATVETTLRGELAHVDALHWSGPAQGPVAAGTGILTLTGIVNLVPPTCCTEPGKVPADARNVLTFRWTSPAGNLQGCVINTIYRRPQGRWVWDGPGRVTQATGALRRFRGRKIGIGGVTRVSEPKRAHIAFSANARPAGRC